MFKAIVKVDQKTDLDGTIRRLAERSASSRLAPDVLELVLEQTRKVIGDFLERGMPLYNTGSQMSVSQSIDGPGYSIKIHARFGAKESIWDRIIGVLTRQHRV